MATRTKKDLGYHDDMSQLDSYVCSMLAALLRIPDMLSIWPTYQRLNV